jgi:hypothetical protein
MRRFAILAAVLIGAASPALAQTQAAPPVTAPPPEPPIPSIAEDRAAAAALTADLTALDQEIYTDEVRMTQLRNTALASENARIRAIRPALKFHGPLVR